MGLLIYREPLDIGGEVVDGREELLPLDCLSGLVLYFFYLVVKATVSLAIIRTWVLVEAST